MARAETKLLRHLPGDRPSTPPDLPPEDQHPQPLKAHPPAKPAKPSRRAAATHSLPANPPSSPTMLLDARCQSESPPPMRGRPDSPLSPPATPPPSSPQRHGDMSFRFSKRLMKSKKLSSSVHGTLTQPVIYDMSDDEQNLH
ncbi:hypothetical protein N7G274_006627 [Stereocaulon virgatum]|uniref:Uncharacterized protein n=1 Tax=Stereocaulon virgatum TaxID=373712 RepID=A0ABR4A4S5_9LECA